MRLNNLNWLLALCVFPALHGCTKDPALQNSVVNSSAIDEAKLTSKLVAWYTFNGNVKDQSGNRNDVVFNNATPASGKKGVKNTAYKFDGHSQFMRVLNSPSLQGNAGQAITLAAVVKIDGFYTGQCHGNRILQKGEDKDYGLYSLGFDDQLYWSNVNDFCDQPASTKFENFYGSYGFNSPNSYADARGGDYIKTGRWYTVVYSYDPKTKMSKLYINNNKPIIANYNGSVEYYPNSKDLYIGRMENEFFPYWFNGVIDEIRIYNSVVTDSEAKFVFDSINE